MTGVRRTSALTVGLLAIGIPLASWSGQWPFVVTGVSDGAVYALAALGLVLTFKTSGIFNFAIGAQSAASAYVFHGFRDQAGWPWPLAALATLLLVGLLGALVLERIAFWLADAPPVMKVVATLGLIVGLQSALTAVYGVTAIQMAPFLPTESFSVGGTQIQVSQVCVTVLALVSTIGLYVFFRFAHIGMAMQALVDDPELLAMQGTSPVAVRRYAWAIGSCFVSVSGMLIAPTFGIDVNTMLLIYITAFGAAALGAFDNLAVTFLAAVGIGIVSNVMNDQLADRGGVVLSTLYTQVPFLALVLALIVVPRSKLIERGTKHARRIKVSAPLPPRRAVPIGAVCVAAVALAPLVIPSTDLSQFTAAAGFSIVLMSLGLLLYSSGQISLCQMALAAVGATTFAHLQHAGLPWVLALLVAGLVAVPVGALIAIPTFRLSGVYLAVATFGVGLLFQNLVYTTSLMFGADNAERINRPGPEQLSSDRGFYYVVVGIAMLCAGGVLLVRRSRLGRLLRALAESPAAVDAHGANTRLSRLSVFCLSAFIAAIGGALIGATLEGAGGVANGAFGYVNSLVLVAVLVICGSRPILAPVIAAAVFIVLKIYPPFNGEFFISYSGVLYGGLAVAIAVAPGVPTPRLRGRGAERDVASRLIARRTLAPAEASR